MVTDEVVLAFFRKELPLVTTLGLKAIPVELDTVLQEYSEIDDLAPVINKYSEVYNIDVAILNIENYYPWEIPWFFRKWFITKPVEQSKKALTVRMFAESAKAGRWLYD